MEYEDKTNCVVITRGPDHAASCRNISCRTPSQKWARRDFRRFGIVSIKNPTWLSKGFTPWPKHNGL